MTDEKKPTLVGVFEDRYEAQKAVDDLRQAGFAEGDVDFALRGEEAVAGGMITDAPLTRDGRGALKGILGGGLAGIFVAAVASIFVPDATPLVDMGLVGSIVGFGAAGAAIGGIFGAMFGLGVSEHEAKVYDKEFQAGKAIVTVAAPAARSIEARLILRRHGAHNLQNELENPLHPANAI